MRSLTCAPVAAQVMHIIAAQNVVRWARKRYDLGLGGFGYPWEEGGEEAWLMLGRPHNWSEEDELLGDSGGDVPPRSLADTDSLFVECSGITVHYKEAVPPHVRPGPAQHTCSKIAVKMTLLIDWAQGVSGFGSEGQIECSGPA